MFIYASTPRKNFPDALNSYFQDGFHSETSNYFNYPEQQLNTSSRNPRPLSQIGQTNNSNPIHLTYQEHYPDLSQSGQINNFNPTNSLYQEYRHKLSPHDQFSKFNPSQSATNQKSSANFPIQPEIVHDEMQEVVDDYINRPITTNSACLDGKFGWRITPPFTIHRTC